MKRVLSGVFGGVLIVLLTVSGAWAQATAQLSGTVKDSSGGVLPGADVTVTQTETGFKRSVVSEDERNALIDVWRAEQNPVLASGIVTKPAQRTAAARPAPQRAELALLIGRIIRDRTPRQRLLIVAISLCLLIIVGMLLAR